VGGGKGKGLGGFSANVQGLEDERNTGERLGGRPGMRDEGYGGIEGPQTLTNVNWKENY